MLHVARPPYIGYQCCDRCKRILAYPGDPLWPVGALVSVLTPTDSDPATPCKSVVEQLAEMREADARGS